MADKISGELHVANDVLAEMAGYAARQVYGVVGISTPDDAEGISRLLPLNKMSRGVVVSDTKKGVHVDVYVIIEYGTNISTVSQNLAEAIEFTLKTYAEVPIEGVEVHVNGVKVRK